VRAAARANPRPDSIRRIDSRDRASVGRARPRAPLTMTDATRRWNWVSIAAAILLACYLCLAIWALAAPSEHDPQQGMAIGFIIPVALVLGGLLLLLWRAVVRGRRWLVWTIFVLAAFPAVMLAAQFVYEHFFRTPG
jgi:peptidoglycan/LPS O-acetylase OafA/YrhL